MERDRNLLFSVFAVQLKGVAPALLMEAAAAWTTDPSISVGQRLVEKGVLSEEDKTLIERLVNEAVHAHGGNATRALDSFGGEEHIRRSLSGELDTSELDAMDTAPMTSFAYFTGRDAEITGVEESPGRYTLISHHAKGGMGRVLLVHDEFLGRNIALKELLPGPTDSAATDKPSPMRHTASMVARFLQEARVTGQLEHPAIVPVYELGRREDGTLYYTMKLVRGKTLLQALRDCKTLQDRLALLPNFMDLCQAIAYAHSRAVIHRDIKPANVMLGQFGETVVLDWGLAKVRDAQDIHLEDIENTLHFLELEQDDALPKTAYGRALGTPHYMPPEQAEGRVDAIDERSDVYSLGAVLYEILTGTTPYTGKGTRDILDKVINALPVPVLKAAADVPPPLAMICEKALQKEPERRYQSAGELAEDIQRFVAGSLVRAYRYSLREIISHYYRNHRGVIRTVAVFILLLAATGAYSYVSIMNARDLEHAQRLVAEQAQRDEAFARAQEMEARARAERSNYVNQVHLMHEYVKSQNQGSANEVADETAAERRGWELGLLLNEANPEVLTIETPQDTIGAVTISPDGSLLATVSIGKAVQVWDLATGALKTTCEGTGLYVAGSAVFSPDSTRVLTPGGDESVRIWAVGSGKLLHRLSGHPQRVIAAVFSEDGTEVLSGATDGAVRVWNAISGELVSTLETGFASILRLALSPGGKVFAVVSDQARIKVWDRATLGVLIECPGRDIVFSGDGRLLATSDGNTASVWDLATGMGLRQFSGVSSINRLRFNKASSDLIAGFQDGAASVWNIGSGGVTATFHHGAPIEDAFFTDDDGGAVVTCARDNTFAAWDVATGAVLNRMAGRGRALGNVAFTADGRRMVTAVSESFFQVWDPLYRTGCRLLYFDPLCGADLAVSPEGQVATCKRSGVWLAALDGSGVTHRFFSGSCGEFASIATAFSRDGDSIAFALDATAPSIWRFKDRELLQLFGHTGIVKEIDFDAAGKRVATASEDGTARIWDANTGEAILIVEGHADDVLDVVFSPDGKTIATASRDNRALLWDTVSGARQQELSGHKGAVCECAFSADGSRVYTASEDKTVCVWDVAGGKLLSTLAGHAGAVGHVSTDSRNGLVFSGSWDGAARVWDARDFQLLATLHGVGEILSWPMVVSFNDGRIEHFDTADVDVATSGSDAAAPSALFAAFREEDHARAAAMPLPSRVPDEQITIVSETKAQWALRKLATAFETKAAAAAEAATANVVLGVDIPYEACYFAGLETNDVLLQAGERRLAGFADAAEALNQQLTAWAAMPRQRLDMLASRGGIQVRMVLIPGETRDITTKVELSRTEAAALMQMLISGLVARREDFNWPYVLESAALEMGMGIGVNIMGRADRALFQKAGIAGYERLVRIDNTPVSEYDETVSHLTNLERQVAAGDVKMWSLDLQRGEFARVHCEYSIQKP